MKERISLERVIRTAIESYLLETHTSMPGIIERVNSNTVDVSIVVKRTKTDGKEINIPTLARVPVMYFGNSKFEISFPVSKGDEGMVLFCERDIATFIKNGKISSPSVFRVHDYSDAIFIPASLSVGKRGSISQDGIVIRDVDNGFSATFDSNGIIMKNLAGTSSIELTNAGIDLLGLIQFESVPGVSGADRILNTHTHTETGGVTGPPL